MQPHETKQLRILVETVVRPWRAGQREKLRLREELMAKLVGIYEDELARGAEPVVALQRCHTRLADAAALAPVLQPRLSWFSLRYTNVFFNYFCTPPSRSGKDNTLKRIGHTAFFVFELWLLSCLLTIVITLLMTWSMRISISSGDVIAAAILAVLVWVHCCIHACIVVILADCLWEAIVLSSKRPWGRIAFLLGTALLVPGTFFFGMNVFILGVTIREGIDSTLYFMPALGVAGPYCLVFFISIRWRILKQAICDTWHRRVVVDLMWSVPVALVTFMFAVALSRDFSVALENVVLMVLITTSWLIPVDLKFSNSTTVAEILAIQEWESSPVNVPKKASGVV